MQQIRTFSQARLHTYYLSITFSRCFRDLLQPAVKMVEKIYVTYNEVRTARPSFPSFFLVTDRGTAETNPTAPRPPPSTPPSGMMGGTQSQFINTGAQAVPGSGTADPSQLQAAADDRHWRRRLRARAHLAVVPQATGQPQHPDPGHRPVAVRAAVRLDGY